MNTEILDNAFRLVKPAFNEISIEEAKLILFNRYPDEKEDIVMDAFKRACDLADACYDFGDKCRDNILTHEGAVKLMEKQFPGFSHGTYESALGYGFYLSR